LKVGQDATTLGPAANEPFTKLLWVLGGDGTLPEQDRSALWWFSLTRRAM